MQGPKSKNLGPEAARHPRGPSMHKHINIHLQIPAFDMVMSKIMHVHVHRNVNMNMKVAQILKRRCHILVRPGVGA